MLPTTNIASVLGAGTWLHGRMLCPRWTSDDPSTYVIRPDGKDAEFTRCSYTETTCTRYRLVVKHGEERVNEVTTTPGPC